MSAFRDITGQRFGLLVAVCCVGKTQRGHSLWQVSCDCGGSKVVLSNNLLRGATKSCGCRLGPLTHGHTSKKIGGSKVSPTYSTWIAMRCRCDYPSHKHYHNYGGRGIRVCKRWRKFENFLEDMGERPVGMTLDRKKGWLGYTPSNCRWATREEQANNPTNRSGGRFVKGHTRGGRPKKEKAA